MHSECDAIRDSAFDYRSGELAEVECRRVDDHLDGCVGCANHFSRVATLLDAPSAVADEAAANIDPDALFARITAQIGLPNGASETMVIGKKSEITQRFSALSSESTLNLDPSELPFGAESAPIDIAAEWAGNTPAKLDTSWPSRRSGVWWVTAVAAIFAGILATGVWRASRPSDAAPALPILADSERIELPSLSVPSTAVELRATDDALWHLSDEPESPRVLTVDTGAVLVEYLPDDGRDLTVHAPNRTFVVVGTVFFVDARTDETSVGVLTGAIEIEGETLVDGGMHDQDGTRTMSGAERAQWTGHVDVAMHQVRLEAAAERAERIELRPGAAQPSGEVTIAAAEVQRTRAEARPERGNRSDRGSRDRRDRRNEAEVQVEAEPVLGLREQAERAMADQRWADAAAAYERLIANGSGSSGARLDLARLYLRRLDRPELAVPHLRAFMEGNPSGPVAESARRELCRIHEASGEEEPLCSH